MLSRRHSSKLDRAERRTIALGVASVGAAGTALVLDALWLKHRAFTNESLSQWMINQAREDAQAAVSQAQVAVEEAKTGYQHLSDRDRTYFRLLASFFISAGAARGIAYRLRTRHRFGPFRDWKQGNSHVHHFVPGVGLMGVSGTAALLSPHHSAHSWLAVPFGTGMGLVWDESALLLRLDDVYWGREGLIGFQITFVTLAVMAAYSLMMRLRRTGRQSLKRSPAPSAAKSIARINSPALPASPTKQPAFEARN